MKIRTKNIIILILFFLILVGVVAYQFFRFTDFDVVNTYDRKDSPGTRYATFDGKILAYNTDGIYHGTPEGKLIWNQPYEFDFPEVIVAKDNGVIYNQGGRNLYIFDTEGVSSEITTGMSIAKVAVASSGVTAVLLKDNELSAIQVYGKDGSLVAEGQYYPENNGYPLDIALSEDGSIMMVSLLDITDRVMSTNIIFYNFGSVGQYELDNIVSRYQYEGMVVPEVTYFEDGRAAAFGTGMVILYSGSQKPKQDKEITYTDEICSVLYDSKHFAIISNVSDPEIEEPYRLDIYSSSGRRSGRQYLENTYSNAKFLNNHQVLLTDGSKCEIYSLLGVRKFAADTESTIYEIIGSANGRAYMLIQQEGNRKIRTK